MLKLKILLKSHGIVRYIHLSDCVLVIDFLFIPGPYLIRCRGMLGGASDQGDYLLILLDILVSMSGIASLFAISFVHQSNRYPYISY